MNSCENVTTVISFTDHLLTCIYGLVMGMLIIVEDAITNVKMNTETSKKNEDTMGKSLFLIAVINAILATLKLPILNGVLFISRVHLKSLTKWNIHSINSHKFLIPVKVLDTRIPCLLCNIMLCSAIFFLDTLVEKMNHYLIYTILLYCSYLVLHGNQLYTRVALIFVQPSKYPANELLRMVPFYKIHIFTIIELLEISVLGALAFNSNAFGRTLFPVCFVGVVVIRHFMLNRLFNQAELAVLDRWANWQAGGYGWRCYCITMLYIDLFLSSSPFSYFFFFFFFLLVEKCTLVLLMTPLVKELWSNNWQVIHLNGSFTRNEKWKKAKCIKEDWALVVSYVCLSFPSFDPHSVED